MTITLQVSSCDGAVVRMQFESRYCHVVIWGLVHATIIPDMTRWLCVGLVRCAKIWQHVLYAPRGVEVCVGMKQVEVRVIMNDRERHSRFRRYISYLIIIIKYL